MKKLNGKVAIITGSTSGMGKETALEFAREGAKVIVTGRNEKRAKATVDQIKAEGGEAIYVLGDTEDLSSAQKIFDETMAKYGTVDILFNNAGMHSNTPFMELTMEEWNKVMNVNINMTILLGQLCAKVMKEKGNGVILNTSSGASQSARWGVTPYNVSKFATNGLTASMARELAPEIRVNAILPGAIRTPMFESATSGNDIAEQVAAMTPLHRVGEVSDIAKMAVFLASDDASYITGQMIRVDGGVDC